MVNKTRLKKVKKMIYRKPKEMTEDIESSEESISESTEKRMIIESAVRPPYQVILDTNFINDCIRKKQNLEHILIKALEGDIRLLITECVYGELEKLGRVYRLALNMIKNIPHDILKCQHKGTYADDCILKRVSEFKCYVVATSDTNLRQRIKKIKGVPIVFFRGYKLHTERFAGTIR